jgi:hypothetical protein
VALHRRDIFGIGLALVFRHASKPQFCRLSVRKPFEKEANGVALRS